MLTLIGYILLAGLAAHLLQLCYVLAQAVVGSRVGATVEDLCVGVGPELFTLPIGRFRCRVKSLPLSGFTKFHGTDFHGEEAFAEGLPSDPAAYDMLPGWRRLLILLSGPLVYAVFGTILIGIPVVLQAPTVCVSDQGQLIEPSCIPQLRITEVPVTFERQQALFNVLFVEYLRGRHFLPRQTWAGPFGYWLTTAAVARQSLPGFLSIIGVLAWAACVFNLLPIPVLNGGHIVMLLIRPVFRISERRLNVIHALGLACLLGWFVLLVLSDVVWFFRLLTAAG